MLKEVEANVGEIVSLCTENDLEYYLIVKSTFEEEAKEFFLKQCLIGLIDICEIDSVNTVFFSKHAKFLLNSSFYKSIFDKKTLQLFEVKIFI